MTAKTYKTIQITGLLTRKVTRNFRVPSYVSNDDFLEAIDNDQLDSDFADWNEHLWNVQDEDWTLIQQDDGLCFKTFQSDRGGEDVDGIFPDKKTVRIEITTPAATVYTFNVPADTDLEDLQHLIATSPSYSASVDLLYPTDRSGLVPDHMPSSTRVVIDEIDHNEYAPDASAQVENLRAKNASR